MKMTMAKVSCEDVVFFEKEFNKLLSKKEKDSVRKVFKKRFEGDIPIAIEFEERPLRCQFTAELFN
jgi:hypothetical protein